jgi:PAS domain S-box-containing protein
MKIKTKLYLSSLIPIILVAILILVKIITLSGVDEQNKQRAASRQTLQAVSELDILTYNYLLSHEKIIEQQWHSKYASLGKSLATLKPDKEEKAIVNRLIQNYGTIGASFSELLADTNESTTSRLAPQFLISSQSMIGGASALVEKNVKDMLNIQTLNDQLILSLAILLLLSGIITSVSIYRVIAKSLHILHSGADKVGEGNLDYKFDINNKDEIGQVAKTFNKMTANLKTIIATKSDLEKEISKRKNVETTLRKSEEKLLKFSQAVNQSPASVVITDLKGSIEYVNQGFADSTGYSYKEALGKNPRILKSGMTSPEIYKQLWKTIISDKEWNGELCNKKKNGELYWEQVSISPVKNSDGKITSFLAVKNDITKLKKAEEELRENKEQLNLALTAAKMGTFVWDIINDRRIWDNNVHRLFGRKPNSFSGNSKEFLQLIHPDDQGKVQADMDKAIKTGIYDTEYRAVWSNGNIVYIAARGKVYYDKSKKPLRMVAVCWDITELKNLDQRKDDFITIAGHELRTPVSAIKIMNQILQDMFAGNPQALKYLKKIDNQATIQSTLINDLLSVSKIQTSKLEIRKEKFDLQSLVKETVEDMQETTKTHKILLKGRISGAIFSDKEKVRQVLVNFLTNAIKFSPKAKKLVVKIEKNRETATLRVTDFGIGIPKTHHNRIFDRFYRAYGSGNKQYPGLGMGLYISSEIIKLLDGKMWFESTPGKGSTFYFSLPFKT